MAWCRDWEQAPGGASPLFSLPKQPGVLDLLGRLLKHWLQHQSQGALEAQGRAVQTE